MKTTVESKNNMFGKDERAEEAEVNQAERNLCSTNKQTVKKTVISLLRIFLKRKSTGVR